MLPSHAFRYILMILANTVFRLQVIKVGSFHEYLSQRSQRRRRSFNPIYICLCMYLSITSKPDLMKANIHCLPRCPSYHFQNPPDQGQGCHPADNVLVMKMMMIEIGNLLPITPPMIMVIIMIIMTTTVRTTTSTIMMVTKIEVST